jgi:putative phage-type endonuclease
VAPTLGTPENGAIFKLKKARTAMAQGRIILAPQGSPEWFAARLGNVTASRFADVIPGPRAKPGEMQKAARTYMEELLDEYLTGQSPPELNVAATRWGHDHEAEAREWAAGSIGEDIDTVGFVYHPTIPRVGCSPDGLIGGLDHGTAGLECKCPYTGKNHVRTLMSQSVPDEYWAQVQGSMWVTGRERWWFVSYNPRVQDERLKGIVIPVERDEIFISQLEAAVVRFVEVYLQSIQELAERGTP